MSHHHCKGCREYAQLSRRNFLGVSAGALAASLVPAWLPRVALADSESSSRDVIVSLFLRGGADSLTLCVPHGEDAYYQLRPGLAVPRPDAASPDRAIDLDGFFGLPPALAALEDVYRGGDLAIVHACGLPGTSRSHFDAMHDMEVGMGDPPASMISGWLGRHLQITSPTLEDGFLRAVGIGAGLQRTLVGAPETLPIADLAEFGLAGDPQTFGARRQALETMYAAVTGPLGDSSRNTFSTIELLQSIDFDGYQPSGGAEYPEGPFGTSLRSTAALIKAEVGVEAVALDYGGWDTHEFQGPLVGEMATLMGGLATGLAAFHQDLESSGVDNVVLVAMSEFGRNAIENGSDGTDHGHGGAMLAMGRPVDGGRVIAQWPGLERELLYDGQDLQITLDYRDILAEILAERLENPDVGQVFDDPTYTPTFHGIVT